MYLNIIQTPSRLPMILASWYSCPGINHRPPRLHPTTKGSKLCSQQSIKEMTENDIQDSLPKDCHVYLCSVGLLQWGDSCHVSEALKQPSGEVHMARN